MNDGEIFSSIGCGRLRDIIYLENNIGLASSLLDVMRKPGEKAQKTSIFSSDTGELLSRSITCYEGRSEILATSVTLMRYLSF